MLPTSFTCISCKSQIHVQYTQIDSSRIQALTTRLSGSLLVNPTGSGSFFTGSYDCEWMSRNVVDSLRPIRLDTMLSTRYDSTQRRRLVTTRNDILIHMMTKPLGPRKCWRVVTTRYDSSQRWRHTKRRLDTTRKDIMTHMMTKPA